MAARLPTKPGFAHGDFWKENRRRLEISSLLRPGRQDPLDQLWKDQELLFTRGEVQLAALVRPDEDVTQPPWVGRPTHIAHSPDPRFAAAADELVQLVTELPYLEPPPHPQIQSLLDNLSATPPRASWRPVPDSLARGRECYLSVVDLHRNAMPDRWLAGDMFPMLCRRAQTPAITLLPSEYWPADPVRSWRAVEPPAENTAHEGVVVRGYACPTCAFFVGSALAVDRWFTLTTGAADPFGSNPSGWRSR